MLADAGVGEHLRELARDWHQVTWFASDALDTVAVTERGAVPGDPLADLMFNVCMRFVLRPIERFIDVAADRNDGVCTNELIISRY